MKFFRKIVKYFQEVRIEMGKVNWPTRRDTIRLTLIVIIASVFIGVYVGALDYLFTSLLALALPS